MNIDKYIKNVMMKYEMDIRTIIFYILGVFTTIQLFSIAGVTMFNLALMFTVAIFIVTMIIDIKNSKITNLLNNINIDKYFIVSFITTLMTALLSIINKSLSKEFKKASLIGGIIYLLILIIYYIMNFEYSYAEKLIEGFEISCKITLIWCVLQLVLFYLLKIDVNDLFFGKILGIPNATGDYYNGSLIPSGFYSHRAILMPSLFYLFFSASNIYICVLILLIGCLTRSTAIILGLLMALLARMVISIFKIKNNKVSKKKIINIIIIVIVGIIFVLIFKAKFIEMINYIWTRITDVTSNKADNSSVVHMLYYKSFGEIFKNLNFLNVLFGTGFGTSGQHYTWYNGQYANLGAWVVESDYINIFLNQGFIGLLLWIYIFVDLIIISIKYKYWENIAFVLIIVCIGVMYNIQFSWFIIVELAMWVLTKNQIRIFNVSDFTE